MVFHARAISWNLLKCLPKRLKGIRRCLKAEDGSHFIKMPSKIPIICIDMPTLRPLKINTTKDQLHLIQIHLNSFLASVPYQAPIVTL